MKMEIVGSKFAMTERIVFDGIANLGLDILYQVCP